MRTYDFAPLWRSTIGFDRLFDLVDAAQRAEGADHYPPYNIERISEDSYQISLALAGFSPDEITVTAEQNVLAIEGRKAEETARITCIRESRPVISSARSIWPTTSRSKARRSRTVCC